MFLINNVIVIFNELLGDIKNSLVSFGYLMIIKKEI